MSNEEIARKLEEFQDYLSISNIFTDILRWIAWGCVQGLAWIVDMLENLTNDILLIKNFYNNPEIVQFIDTIKPFLYILLAFSLLYTGYLLIFNKKFDREGIVVNIFIACIIVISLNTGMDKANEFTDAAIEAVKVDALYPNDESTLSGSIIQRNVNDLTEIDKNNWSTTDLTVPNSTPPSKIANINVREKYGKDTEGISSEGKEISKYMLSLNNFGEYRAEKFDQSGLEYNNEYYFRYSINWFTIFVTLGIIAFTLFSIALKLAKLFFELTFNYILALIIAPADVHDGQKTKKILQAILNTFLATILIFLSMKVYMIGTAYLENTLSTFPYLIALIAFSLAVVDGPNIVERLFGIDAGLKNGWGILAGAYAGSKLVSGTGKLATKSADFMTGGKLSNAKDSLAKFGNRNRKGMNGTKAPSPNAKSSNDKPKNNSNEGIGIEETDTNEGAVQGVEATEENTRNSSGAGSISRQAEKQTQQRKQTKAPSPNDADNLIIGASQTTSNLVRVGGSQFARNTNATEIGRGTDNATVQQNTGVTGVENSISGGATGSTKSVSGSPSPATSGFNGANGSRVTERHNIKSQSIVEQETAVTNEVQELWDNTTTHTTRSSGGTHSPTQAPSNTASVQAIQQASAQTVTNVVNVVHQTQNLNERHPNTPSIKQRPSSYMIPKSSSINHLKNHFARNK